MEQFVYVCALIVLKGISYTRALATFEVRMIQFENDSGDTADGDCCDRFIWCFGRCENQFTFCLDQFRSPINTDTGTCSFGKFVTGEFPERDDVSFGTDMQGVSNPIRTEIRGVDSIVLKVRVMDIDVSYDDLLDTIHGKLEIASFGSSSSKGSWTRSRLTGRRRSSPTSLTLEFRAYCESHYYGPTCDVHCVPQDNANGHYTCDQESGNKLCRAGWENPASSCRTLDDSCPSSVTCQHGGTCRRVRGISTCTCVPEYTGTNCGIAVVCLRDPCQNGGQCSPSSDGFKCSCPAAFTGAVCETAVVCLGQPCQNGGQCAHSDDGFKCSCPAAFTGSRCEVDTRDPCDSGPCLNSGTCSSTPDGYSCSCTNGYTGGRCQKDVTCDGNCHNGGSCIGPGQCSCAPCYTGQQCDTYLCARQPTPSCTEGINCLGGGRSTRPTSIWIWIGNSSGIVVIIFIFLIIVCARLGSERNRRDGAPSRNIPHPLEVTKSPAWRPDEVLRDKRCP